MKSTKILLTGLLLFGAGVTAVSAQTVSGRVVNAPWFDAGHRMLFSQSNRIYGTARSAAMGGAFASLGADLSSMSINPAGLGMYQSSDWGITQALSIDGMRTSADFMRQEALSEGGNRVSYGLNNVGMAYNVLNSSGTLTSLTLGFGYNRVANFNSRTRVETFGEDSSIADMFARQLNFMADDGVRPGALEPSADPFYNNDIRLGEWASVLGYQTGLAGINDEGAYGHFIDAIPSDSYFESLIRGGIYEYNFSLGANIGNVLYLGATVGVTQINYREETSYGEFYTSGSMFGQMWFDQSTRIAGTGLTAKLGAIVRPAPSLRIGVAFHLPNYYSLEKSYTGDMGTDSSYANTGDALVDENLRFNSAPRLLAGISGVIGERAIVALDYEVAWYNKIRMRGGVNRELDDSKAEARKLYRPGHTLRAGLEIRASDRISVRAGGSWMADFMRDKHYVTNNPTPASAYSLTAGVGFNIGTNGYIDLAYIYNRSRYTDYDFYYFKDAAGDVSSQYDVVDGTAYDREYSTRRNHNMIAITLGTRF